MGYGMGWREHGICTKRNPKIKLHGQGLALLGGLDCRPNVGDARVKVRYGEKK